MQFLSLEHFRFHCFWIVVGFVARIFRLNNFDKIAPENNKNIFLSRVCRKIQTRGATRSQSLTRVSVEVSISIDIAD